MDPARTAEIEPPSGRMDGLQAEAASAVSGVANVLRSVRQRYREAYAAELGEWQARRAELDDVGRAAEPGDSDLLELRAAVERLAANVANHQTELARLDLALRHVESTWLFLERGDKTLVGDDSEPSSTTDLQMRIVEAQESERSRLAQEVHDGPAQALSNAIFQVEYIERVLDRDPALARSELRYLRELLRRELGDVRSFITQLRPPVLDELGLDGAIRDTAERMTELTGLEIELRLQDPGGGLGDAARTVALRVAQEALQNVRKHASATVVVVTTRVGDGTWIMEVRDDGRGFDPSGVAARGRRNFGLQFMRERAELVGGTVDVRSSPEGGTLVRLAIPLGAEESR